MAILVTGGAGFIGTNFVLKCIKELDEHIINLDKLTYAGNLDNLKSATGNKRHIFIQGDIGNRHLVDDILQKHKPRAIINFAAESHVDRSISSPEQFLQTNVLGTFSLLESVRNYWQGLSKPQQDNFRFLHISTDEVYGTLAASGAPFSEANQYQPNSPYSASKAASDHFVRAYHHTYGLPVLTTNCSNNYGPYQFPEKLIPLTIHNALNGKEIPIYGDGLQIRDWLFVEDHCDAIMRVLNRGNIGEVYNIGGLSEKTNIEVVEYICQALDKLSPRADTKSYKSQITHIKDRPGHDKRYAIDTTKIKESLGWAPKLTFEEGISRTIRWYLDNLNCKQENFTNENTVIW